MATRKYELLVVLPGTLNDNEAAARINDVVAVVKQSAEGEPELNTLGKNRLAYPIKQIRYGYFYTIVFSAEPEKISALEEKMRLSREVLRSMVTIFNTTLTAQQRQAYTPEGISMMHGGAAGQQRAEAQAAPDAAAMVEKMVAADAEASKPKVASRAERKIENTNLEEINKKLDDLMSGDVIPTV